MHATGNLKKTRFTTIYARGDVVLVPFGFTDRSGSKWRPAVIVSADSYNRETPDVIIASITGNLRALRHPGDHELQEWQAVGLLRPSLVQAKLATVEASFIGRRLGNLRNTDLAAVNRGIRQALQLD